MMSRVAVSAPEVVRMVAMLVMQRPENAGKSTTAIEMHHDAQGIANVVVVMFDTAEEAQGYTKAMAEAAAQGRPAASVLTMVPGGKPAEPEAPKAALAQDVPGAP